MRPALGRLIPIFRKFVPILWVILPAFGRIIPGLIAFFLNRTLGGWKSKGLIENYGTRTVRSGRMSYGIEICVVLTTEQAGDTIHELLARAIGYVSPPNPSQSRVSS
jgi:hypothetical protein